MALKIFPNSPQVHVNLGNALVNRWQLEEALFHYKEALRLNPKDHEAQMNLSSVQRMIAAEKLRHRKTTR
jgi:tetratricopeptide (TPR) repeat protein